MSSVAPPLPASPYKGLSAFEDSQLDALFFFGRERERDVIVANMLASRLTVLYGESGVGKSSLLAAAVVRTLRSVAPGAAVVVHGTWADDPRAALAVASAAGETYLILDQFEEYFVYHGQDDSPGTLLHELPELLLANPRLNVLISLREDALAELDVFKASLPGVFANRLRLEHLDREAAHAAIVCPVERWNELTGEQVELEPALVEALLDEVSLGRVDAGDAGARVARARSGDRIEAPYLQLVLERIWDAERRQGSTTLRLATLRSLGGAETIVREHVDRALGGLSPGEKDVAARMFEYLVTPSGTKMAQRAGDLAEYAQFPVGTVLPVIGTLNRERILRSVAGANGGGERYEIFHDVLAQPIREWRLERRVEEERQAAHRRQRRLYVVVGLVLVALLLVGGLAVWALSERSKAEDQARHARAGELDAKALQRLDVDPNRSVALALTAAALEPGATTENVLRQALVSDRLRLVRHMGAPVRAVAVSPRGDLVAVAAAGRKLLVLDARNRKLLRTIRTPRAVAALSFAGERRLVTASPERVAAVWDVASGRRIPQAGPVAAARTTTGSLRLVPLRGELRRTIAHVRSLSAGPGGEVAAVVAEPGGPVETWVFDRDGTLLRVLPGRGIRDAEFSPDGQLLAAASAKGFTTLWDPVAGRRVRTLRDAKSGVDVVAFSPDGNLLATGAADGGVRIWNPQTGVRVYFLFGHTNPVSTLAWSPDGRVVASAGADRKVLLWRLQGLVGSGSLAATLAGSGGAVRALAFSPDGGRLVSGGDDAAVRIWDARPDEELDLLGRAPGPALAARWAGTSVAALWPQTARIYDPRTRRLLHVLPAPRGAAFTSLAASGAGRIVAAGRADGTTVVWDARSGARLAVLRGGSRVVAVAVSPRGDVVAAGDVRGGLRAWSVPSGRLRWSAHERGAIRDVSFAPDGARVVAAGAAGAAIRSTASGVVLHRLASPQGDAQARFSRDGRLVATAGLDASLRLWFAGSGNLYRVLHGHTKALTAVAFSPSGRLVATSGEDADAWVWDVRHGLGHALQRSAFGPISGIAVDSTGRWIAGAAPISAIVWGAAGGSQLFYLRGDVGRLTSVSFAPAAPTVLTSSRDGTVRTYTCWVCVDLPTLAHEARVRLAQAR